MDLPIDRVWDENNQEQNKDQYVPFHGMVEVSSYDSVPT